MKRILIQLLVCSTLFFGLSTCTIFKKNIAKKVIIALPDTLYTPTLSSTALNAKYTVTITPQQVLAYFLKGFKEEGKNTANVTVQFSSENADFILKFKYLNVVESSTTQTITDPKSPYNGKSVVLNTVDVSAEFEMTDPKNPGEKAVTCSNSKQRSEKETNNRSLDDLISGTNKDNTSYRTKLLNDIIGLTLSEDVGRRIWVPITRRVAKKINK